MKDILEQILEDWPTPEPKPLIDQIQLKSNLVLELSPDQKLLVNVEAFAYVNGLTYVIVIAPCSTPTAIETSLLEQILREVN